VADAPLIGRVFGLHEHGQSYALDAWLVALASERVQ